MKGSVAKRLRKEASCYWPTAAAGEVEHLHISIKLMEPGNDVPINVAVWRSRCGVTLGRSSRA
ncbi:MAG: hypothetical protein ACI8QC_003482, partial [Planctomycetota bacterium]